MVYSELGKCGLIPDTPRLLSKLLPFNHHAKADSRPDIVTMAKPLANGFPIGAIMVRDAVAETIAV